MTEARIALVTGGNRGLGLEVCHQLAARGLHVLLTARNEASGEQAAEALRQTGGMVEALPLDVTDQASVHDLALRVQRTYGRVDVLVNNAAILDHEGSGALETPAVPGLRARHA